MEQRALGRSGITVPTVVLGANVFGWTADAQTSMRLLDRALEAGLVAIDTADIYSRWAPGHSGGESEAVIGDWLARSGARRRVVLMTKVGGPMDGTEGLAPARIVSCVEGSLRRLRTDVIDLYQSHFDDPAVPVADVLGAYARLIEHGKVRAIGASNLTAARLSEALEASAAQGLPRYEALQPHYNLMERAFEAELGPLCRREQVGVIPYFGLAAGFLTGKYRSRADLAGRARAGNVERYLDARGDRVLAALDAVAAAHSTSPTEVALAWLAAKPGVTAPIASATSLDQLEHLIAAASLRLDGEEVERLDRAGGDEA